MVVRRHAKGPFWIAVMGVPLLAVFYDFATGGTLLNRLAAVIYPGDIDVFEVRDVIWSAVFVVVGVVAVTWGVWELAVPRKVLFVDEAGVLVQLRGLLHRNSRISWSQLEAVEAISYVFDGESTDGISITISDHATLPRHPWGARWLDDHTLAIDAGAWDTPVAVVVSNLAGRIEAREAPPSEGWGPSI